MTNTLTISLKMPVKTVERIPAAGNGRSRFILEAVEEKLSRQSSDVWKPTTARGKRMAAVLRKAKPEMLGDADFERELAERRGRLA